MSTIPKVPWSLNLSDIDSRLRFDQSMLQQQILLLKIGVPLQFFWFILSGIDYILTFGFTFTLHDESDATIKKMIELLLRIIFSFLCVFGGSIAILKPNIASLALLIAYVGFNILAQILNFNIFS